MTLQELEKKFNALEALIQSEQNPGLAFKLARAMKQIRPDIETFREQAMELRKELSEEETRIVPDPNDPKKTIKEKTGKIVVKPENMEEWEKRGKELRETEVDIMVNQVKQHEFKEDVPPALLEPLLDWLIIEK